MKKVFNTFLEFLFVVGLMMFFIKLIAFAGSILPMSSATSDVFEKSGLPVPPEGKSGQEVARDVVLQGLAYVKVIIVSVGIFYLTYAGYLLIEAGGEEEAITKARKMITYIVVSFVVISMSQNLAKVFDMDGGSILSSPQEILNRVHLFDKQVEIFVTFVKYVIGGYATIMIVRSGIKMITAGGNDEDAKAARLSMVYSIAGLIILNISNIFIEKVFYKVDKEVYSGITGVHPYVDTKEGVGQIVGITNFIVSFIGPVAVLMLIIAAIMYATAGGDDEKMNKAKRMVVVVVVAMGIIFGAFALISTVVSGRLSEIGVIAQ